MNPWMLFGLAVLAIIIGTLFRNPRQRDSPMARMDDEEDPPPRRIPLPPSLLRRLQPPPLPMARAVPRAEPVVLRPALEVKPAPPPPAAAVVVRETLSSAGMQIMGLLSNRQTLRAAILLREVLDPPLCRRRHGPAGRAAGGH